MIRTVTLQILLLSAITSCAAWAQNSDLGVLYGVMVLHGPATAESGRTGQYIELATNIQLNYARQLLDSRPGGLFIELPVIYNHTTTFFTPGVRFKFSTKSRVSPFVAAGAGVARFGGALLPHRKITGTFEFGGGFDVRFTRLTSFRCELRDFVAPLGSSGIAVRNHPVVSVGIAFHF
jgi:hypothetical protein